MFHGSAILLYQDLNKMFVSCGLCLQIIFTPTEIFFFFLRELKFVFCFMNALFTFYHYISSYGITKKYFNFKNTFHRSETARVLLLVETQALVNGPVDKMV